MRSNLLLVLAIAASTIGCHKADPFIGTWTTTTNNNGLNVQETATHLSNGTFTTHARATKGNTGKALIVEDQGTWKKMSETSYEEKLVDTNWTSEGATPSTQDTIHKRMEQNKAKLIAEANTHAVRTITWQGNDQYTESFDKTNVIYHRAP